MTRTHENYKGARVCSTEGSSGICILDHVYRCRLCGEDFICNESTHVGGFPSKYYPFDSWDCASLALVAGDVMAERYRDRYEFAEFPGEKDDDVDEEL